MSYLETYKIWRENPLFDEETRKEVSSLTDEKEIQDRFYKNLTFGTGGLRGILGAGTNRMNKYTVGKATQGLAEYVRAHSERGSVVIAYDSRNMSYEFAPDSALIFAANGVKAYFFESLRPTPELSFAVRYLHATAGIVITASHNPPEYNGYKVYWTDGGQIVAPHDKLIAERINAIEDYLKIKHMTLAEAKSAGLFEEIGSSIDDAYIGALKSLSLNPEALQKCAKELKIVYTPLNGAGNLPVRRILRELGFENVWVVPEQEQPDGNFPTLEYPNPEDPKAFTYALRLAREKDADLVLATDPDADRLGIYVRGDHSGEYIPFTGNMSGLLIAEYILSQKAEKGLLPVPGERGALVTTIVSSNMAGKIAKEYGLTLIETLTGFKYIGEQMKLFEESGEHEYLFGFEESYGCLPGTHARDKDAVAAVTMLCEAAAFYRSRGLTLKDQMLRIFDKYGYYNESLKSITLSGADGAARISEIIRSMRNDPPREIGGLKVLALRDYKQRVRTEIFSGAKESLTLPESDVLYFELENDGWCCVRPSGTEPKIKFYFGVKGTSLKDAQKKIQSIEADLLRYAE